MLDLVDYAVRFQSVKYRPTQCVGNKTVVEFMYSDSTTPEVVMRELLPLTGLSHMPRVQQDNGWYILEVLLPIDKSATGITGREFSTVIAVGNSPVRKQKKYRRMGY